MKRQFLSKVGTMTVAASMAAMALAGCGEVSEEAVASEKQAVEESITEEPVATTATAEKNDSQEGALYFRKGVYANYSAELEDPTKHYFYVFDDVTYGHTDDADSGTGLPFDYEQNEGEVTFWFGAVDASEEKFIVTSVENNMIYGYFEGVENRPLVFELMEDADPDGFDAHNYTSDGDYIYTNGNGWSIHYDPERFEITQNGGEVSIVYIGECEGTNMVLVTYDVEHNGKEMRDEKLKSYGETAVGSDSVFPGTEDVEGYWASCPPVDGLGEYMTSVSRDYMDGSLTFECIGYNSGDEMLDMEVSDYLAMIIDSLEFIQYGN